MNKGLIAGIVVILLVALAGGTYFFLSQNQSPATQTTTQPTAQQPVIDDGLVDSVGETSESEAMEGEVMMEEEGEAMMEDVVEIVIEGSNFKYSPSTLSVKAGSKVKIVFKNVEGFHDLVIEDLDIGTSRINGGEEESFDFVVPDDVTSLTFFCSVGNHRALGMEGTITVE